MYVVQNKASKNLAEVQGKRQLFMTEAAAQKFMDEHLKKRHPDREYHALEVQWNEEGSSRIRTVRSGSSSRSKMRDGQRNASRKRTGWTRTTSKS